MQRTVVVVNPNTSVATTRLLVAVARDAVRGEDVRIVGETVAQGPSIITTPSALSAAAAHVMTAARRAVLLHAPDAIVVAAFGDPGAAEAAEATGLPVVGIGAAAVRAASAGGRRFAIATTTGRLEPVLRALVADAGGLDAYAGCFLTASPAEELEDPDRLHGELHAAVRRAQAAGAEAVIIGGGPLSAAAERLAAEFAGMLPIVEPIRAAVAEALAATTPVGALPA
ncbi:aspartate/glutamate racemase family protein [Rathayibacter sp. VKM Ac-2926]|uniref:aspartate/glutamate racemase family protein n=1 Tax=Rathayibacter sp. VKM Ac-2926 TaxID=2929477 RepID=UPI001FB243EA|nr:aspartate/glutamate racemase family protein [Rathayibacter sp. VKM Ac-2926]MCJ1706021.1 aspartate/glutamate racemase family protein [Rathayibacter sp. VKM Ac-2926]